jgi:quercetin dioxygenase-like cupin family protein
MITTGRSRKVEPLDLDDGESIFHATKRALIGSDQGARNFAMRLFMLGEGGLSAYHTHPWEHEIFVLSGKGKIKSQTGSVAVSAGDFAHIPAMDEHQFLNAGSEPFEFLCVVPTCGEGG